MLSSPPHFLGIGAQKAGTTSLYKILEQHPDVFIPSTKEIHYFTLNYKQGREWYENRFRPANINSICGEITPYYLFHPLVAERVHCVYPDVKIIVLLRDPVERCLSQYFHSKRLGFEQLGLDEALLSEDNRLKDAYKYICEEDLYHQSHQEHSYLSRSRYEEQIPRWSNLFSESQILVLKSEEFFSSPRRICTKLTNFLEIDCYSGPDILERANSGLSESNTVSYALRNHIKSNLEHTYDWVSSEYGICWP